MALVNKLNKALLDSSSLNVVKNSTNVEKVIATIEKSASKSIASIVLSEYGTNGEEIGMILINDQFITNINALVILNKSQNASILASKEIYNLSDNYELLQYLFSKIFGLKFINVQNVNELTYSKSLKISDTTQLGGPRHVVSIYTLHDAVSTFTLCGLLQIADTNILNLMNNLILNMNGLKNEIRTNIFASIDYKLNDKVLGYGGKFNDSINFQASPKLAISTTITNKLGTITVPKTLKTVANDGKLAVAIDDVTIAYTTLDNVFYTTYDFDLNASYSFSALYSYNTNMSNIFSNLKQFSILNRVSVVE